VDWSALARLDADLFLRVNRLGGPLWELLAGYGTWLGHGVAIALALAAGLRVWDRRRFPKNFLLIALAMVVAGLANTAVKTALERPRPLADPLFRLTPEPLRAGELAFGLRVVEYGVGDAQLAAAAPRLRVIGAAHRYRAFPSGHAAGAFACAAGLVYAFRGRRRWLWLLPAAFVGVTRVACGVHFPLDVAAGALLGCAAAWTCLRPFEAFHGLGSRPRPARPRQGGGPPRIAVVAGEASGDLYGARVLAALRRRAPGLRAIGIGGDGLVRAGLEARGDAAQLEIVGFTAVLTRLPGIVRLYRRMLRVLREERPDVLLCIDLPDFNFMLAQQARALGIPVCFFISPQFWAWRSGRVDKLAPRISKMIVAFPFEVPFYERAGVPVAFHGHPLLEGLEPRHAGRDEARRHFGLEPRRPVCVLAPGSRRSEWRHHLQPLLGAAARMAREMPELQFALPLAPRAREEDMRRAAQAAGVAIRCTRGDNFDLFRCADLGIVCSGTATLEAALAGLPLVAFYRGNWLNALVAKLVVEIDRYALPNIVLGGPAPVYPELIQHRASAAGLARRALALARDEAELARLRDAGARVRKQLAGGATSAAVADELLALAGAQRVPGADAGAARRPPA
jgi:lipid-A-disaccharide synthase